MVNKGLRLASSAPALLAHRSTSLQAPPCRFGDANVTALSAAEAAVVTGLNRDGVFITDLMALNLSNAESRNLVSTARGLASELAQRQPINARVVAEPADVLRRPLLYRWGLNHVLLRIVETYMQQPLGYDGLLLFHTIADPTGPEPKAWHLDREDSRMVKVALYLHDVDETRGPFQVLRKEIRHERGRIVYRSYDTAGLEQALGVQITVDNTITCTGKVGTLVFTDTARFYHRGMPVRGDSRSAIFYSYFGRPPRHPYFCDRSELTRADLRALVAGMEPAQQDCALWYRTLPRWQRIIPPSRV
jgi:hypothetical protein